MQVVAIGLTATVTVTLLRRHSPEFITPVVIVTAIMIFALVVNQFGFIIEMLREIAQRARLDNKQLRLVLKIIGVAYIAQLAASIANDSGESAIASKIELAGKIIILFYTTPVIYSLLNLATGLLP